MKDNFYEIAFTPDVKKAQEHYGSRRRFEQIEHGQEARPARLGDAEIEFIGQRDGFYLATVGEQGQPYIQFRGGKPGFLKIIDDTTLGFADFRGNLQYISVGNLAGNNKVALFLMDYANRARLKIFAEAEVFDAESAPELVEKLRDADDPSKIERALVLHIKAFNWNCPQHITPRYTIEEIKRLIQPLNDHVAKLEKEIAALKAQDHEKLS